MMHDYLFGGCRFGNSWRFDFIWRECLCWSLGGWHTEASKIHSRYCRCESYRDDFILPSRLKVLWTSWSSLSMLTPTSWPPERRCVDGYVVNFLYWGTVGWVFLYVSLSSIALNGCFWWWLGWRICNIQFNLSIMSYCSSAENKSKKISSFDYVV